jgi:hypothetical protein
LLCSGLCALAACAAPAPSSALEPGVHSDPGSPAEKEYVLPLDQARGTGGQASSSHTSSPHLFGAGIKPPSGGTGGGESGGGAQHSSTTRAGRAAGKRGDGKAAVRASGARGGATAGGRGPTLPDAVLRASRSQDSSGNGSLLALIGGGLAILVVGAFGGTVLRHSRRPTPTR